jgi:hypothetical protein
MTLLVQGKGSGSSAVVIVDTNDIGSSRGYVVSSSSCRAVEVGARHPIAAFSLPTAFVLPRTLFSFLLWPSLLRL